MSISRHIRAILTVTMLAAGLAAVAVTFAGGGEPDPAFQGKTRPHGEPGLASATPEVPATALVGPGAALALPMSQSLTELDGAMRRGDSAAVVALWQRATVACVKGGPKGGLCADSSAAEGTLVNVEVVRTHVSFWPIPLAEERLKRWAGGNPGTLVFAATWSPAGELAVAYEVAPRPMDTTGNEVVRYLWFFVDPSSPTPLQTLVFMGDSPLIYWRQFNRPVSELLGVDSSLLTREAEMDKEFANSVATAIAQTTATAVAAGR